MLRHWSQLVPNMSTDIRGHEATLASYMIIVIVQELCESRGGRPGLSVLTSLLPVSVDVKNY